jgi:hypothetical protein
MNYQLMIHSLVNFLSDQSMENTSDSTKYFSLAVTSRIAEADKVGAAALSAQSISMSRQKQQQMSRRVHLSADSAT